MIGQMSCLMLTTIWNYKYRGNDNDSDLFSSKDRDNDVVHNRRYRDMKSFREVQELVEVSLSGENIDNNETQINKKYGEHPPPTKEEEAKKILSVKHLFNDSDPPKAF